MEEMEYFEKISLVTRWGQGIRKPSISDLSGALNELAQNDDEHPATWISDIDGNVVEAHQDGELLFFNHNDADNVNKIRIKEIDKILDIWLLLCKGEKDKLENYFKR